MQLISTPKQLEKEFLRLLEAYDNYHWATAWASSSTKVFNSLFNNLARIKKITVGIHFYQTHPKFIETFLKNKNVRFIQQPEGTFHPKVYLFSNSSDDWEMLIGSANFTLEAFTRNTEANILIKSTDVNNASLFSDAQKLIEASWSKASYFLDEDLERYKIVWQNQRNKLKSLSGMYGSENSVGKPVHEVPVINMKWEDFINKVEREDEHSLEDRLDVIALAKSFFQSVNHFKDLNIDQRKFIAGGITKKYKEDAGYFGRMVGRGDFIHEIIVNNDNISIALDQIPLSGQIVKSHYDNFILNFQKVFTGNYIGVASRLLAMKRPDVFYCLTSKNKYLFCIDFAVKEKEIDYNGYWEHVIARIYDSEWWQHPIPKNELEEQVCNARAAFLDAIYYKR